MTSIDIYKSAMASGLKKFFEIYESSIKELIDKLDSDGLLLRKFTEEQVTRLMDLSKTCNMTLKLSNDFYSIINLDKVKRNENLTYLKKAFRTEDEIRIGEHCLSTLVISYIAILEKLKIYFLFFIDWDKLGKKHKNIYGIRGVIKSLAEKYENNKYLTYFNTETRNSFAHYTFFFGKGSSIHLCSELFDENPEVISLFELMKEIRELGVLVEGFYILLKDKYGLPEIKLEMFEL